MMIAVADASSTSLVESVRWDWDEIEIRWVEIEIEIGICSKACLRAFVDIVAWNQMRWEGIEIKLEMEMGWELKSN